MTEMTDLKNKKVLSVWLPLKKTAILEIVSVVAIASLRNKQGTISLQNWNCRDFETLSCNQISFDFNSAYEYNRKLVNIYFLDTNTVCLLKNLSKQIHDFTRLIIESIAVLKEMKYFKNFDISQT